MKIRAHIEHHAEIDPETLRDDVLESMVRKAAEQGRTVDESTVRLIATTTINERPFHKALWEADTT